MIETVVLTAYIIHLLSLIFVPNDKKEFYIYLLIAMSMMIVLWGYWIFEMKYCPSYYIGFTFVIVIPVLTFSTLLLLDIIKSRLEEKHIRVYVIEQLVSKLISKSLKLIIFIALLFQGFLLFSAFNAYSEAEKINKKYVENNSILDFYSPYIKEIYIDDDTRWSYHRECYLNEWK